MDLPRILPRMSRPTSPQHRQDLPNTCSLNLVGPLMADVRKIECWPSSFVNLAMRSSTAKSLHYMGGMWPGFSRIEHALAQRWASSKMSQP